MMRVPIPQGKFSNFLCQAKRATYAAQEESTRVKPILKGSHQLEFRQGALLYRDIYFGGNFFIGQETVYYKDTPVWAMSYSGGINEGQDPEDTPGIYEFLRAALKAVPEDIPFRGPEELIREPFRYANRVLGSAARFSGIETIQFQGRQIYQLHYSGGFIKE